MSKHHLNSRAAQILPLILVTTISIGVAAQQPPTDTQSSNTLDLLVIQPKNRCPLDVDLPSSFSKPTDRITVHSSEDFARWLTAEGRDYATAHAMFQRLAYAKANHADVIVGIDCSPMLDPTIVRQNANDGPWIKEWWINLRTCASADYLRQITCDKNELNNASATPLLEIDVFDPNGIHAAGAFFPYAVRPRPPSETSVSRREDRHAMIGLRLDGRRVTEVPDPSPARAAGIAVGDEINSCDGVAINSFEDLSATIRKHAPADTVEVTWRRGQVEHHKAIKLADNVEWEESRKLALLKHEAPDLLALDIAGRSVSLRALKGNVVLLSFWATWCGPCKRELPTLQLVSEQLSGKGFIWLNVSVDENEQAWRSFVRNNHLGGVQILAPKWADAFSVRGYPTTFLIDDNGIVRAETFQSDTLANSLWLLEQRPSGG